MREEYSLSWCSRSGQMVQLVVPVDFKTDGASYAPDEPSKSWLFHDYVYRDKRHCGLSRAQADELMFDVLCTYYRGYVYGLLPWLYWCGVRLGGWKYWR